jgi:Lrp/AsnC family transcriptional regulator of ectoine degradation
LLEAMPRLALDDRDVAILAVLSREGRIAKTELARRVNLSATPCWERLRRLEAAGLVTGYRAEIDVARLGPSVTVFVTAEIESHKAESFQAFERAVALHDEIVGCWSVGGGIDYLLQVVARDIEGYQAVIDALLAARVGLSRYFTYIVTKEVKASPPPIELLVKG